MYRTVGVLTFLTLASFPACGGAEPAGRIYHSMLTLNDGSLLMFGGVSRHGFGPMDLRDTWLYDIDSGSWEKVSNLEPGDVIGAAYDEQSDKVITLNYQGETWAFDPSERKWERKNPAIGPSGRCGHGIAYDSQSDRTILFGGFACTDVTDPLLNDTWSYDYDSDTWTLYASASAPPPRIYHSMVYHKAADRILVWGGRVEDSRVRTFDLEENVWTALEQDFFPEGIRAYHSMAFDADSSRMFMFGGLLLTEPMSFEGKMVNETWTYDMSRNEWSLHQPLSSPSVRSHQSMTMTQHGKFFVFGGELNTPYSDEMSDELWVLDPESITWSPKPPQ
jgi:N-acetylneuraminic acid mutarotase